MLTVNAILKGKLTCQSSLGLSNEETSELQVGLDELNKICKSKYQKVLSFSLNYYVLGINASNHGVHLLIDAEYSHLQPAVRIITLALMNKFNRGNDIVVSNTYQCYLVESWKQIQEDLVS